MVRSFREIINSPPHLLNKKELFIQVIVGFLLCSGIAFLGAVLTYSGSEIIFFKTFLSLNSLSVWMMFGIIAISFIGKRFDIFDKNDPFRQTFDEILIFNLFVSFGFLTMWVCIGITLNIFFLFWGIGLSLAFPPWVMFFRRKKCFNESSMIEYDFGYNPKFYYILAAFCGFCTIGFGFFLLQSCVYDGYPPFYVIFDMILFSFVWIGLILCPDIWNKILPFEIRNESGFALYSIIMIFISFVFMFTIILLL